MIEIAYKTKLGKCFGGSIEDALTSSKFERYKKKINLIFTSPPFPLIRKKQYGNMNGESYIAWLSDIGIKLKEFLTDDGSIVMEIGNAWESGKPVMSTLPLKALLNFLERGEYHLCQQFIWYNNARLPSPAQWVNVERIRLKDSFTNIWWMSNTAWPKANNKKVLIEYSDSMKRLLKTEKYNSGSRPSEHLIGKKSFLKNNTGAIPSNVFVGANTLSSSEYYDFCKTQNLTIHPARMPSFLPEFFIKLLTKKGDIVLDPFAGSNTTGQIAEKLKRKWIAVEKNTDYIKGSMGRFSSVFEKRGV